MRIFISRKVDESSPIHKLASKSNTVVGESLINIQPVAFESPSVDWIFFYSKNGVKYFFENHPHAFVPYRYACIGPSTADTMKDYVAEIPEFTGNGTPEEVAKSFKKVLKDHETVCYIRAVNSKDSIHNLLKRPGDFSLPVYSNEPKAPKAKPPFDVLIFTSPLNAKAYFDAYTYTGERIIAIGPSTKKCLLSMGISSVETPIHPSESAIAALLQTS